MKSRTASIILALSLAGVLLAITSAVVVTSAGTDTTGTSIPLNATAPQPLLVITKSGPAQIMGGVPISYTLVVANNLTTTVSGVVITDRIPLGSSYHAGGTLSGDVVSWTVPSLGSGLTLTRQFAVIARTTITNNNYGVRTQDGYSATGEIPVITEVINKIYLPAVTRNYCRDFFDDFFDNFSDPASGWYVGDDAYVRSEYLNGEYRIFTKNPDYFYLYSAPTCPRRNYVLEVDARWVGSPGSSYGLMFGLNDDFSRYYLFDVNTDYQMYRLLRRDPSAWVTIAPVAGSGAIRSGTAGNHLKVTRNGSLITLEVNGAILGSWHDSAINGLTEVGLVSSPYNKQATTDARFDNFKVTRLGGSLSAGDQPMMNLVTARDAAVPGNKEMAIHVGPDGLPNWNDIGR